MNKLINKLPLLAFVLAAFAAVAFTSPKSNDPEPQFGLHNGVWYDVTGQDPGENTYRCDSQVNANCLYDAINGDPISPGENKVFVKMP